MQRIMRISLYCLLGLLVLLAGGVIYLFSSDFTGWKSTIERRLSSELGRSVIIDQFSASIGEESHLTLSNLIIAEQENAPLRAVNLGNLQVGVKLWPLIFSDRLDITYLYVDRLSVAVNSPLPASTPAPLAILPLVRDLNINQLQFTAYDPMREAPIMVTISEASLRAESEQSPQKLTIAGNVDGHKIAFGGTLGSVESLFDDATPWRIDVDGDVGPSELSIKGSVKAPLAGEVIDLKILASGQELVEMAKFMGIIGTQPIGPWVINAHLRGADADHLAVEQFTFNLGADNGQSMGGLRLALDGRISRLHEDGLIDLNGLAEMTNPQALAALKAEWQRFIPELAMIPILPEPFGVQGSLRGSLDSGILLDALKMRYGPTARPFFVVEGEVQDLVELVGLDLDARLDIANFAKIRPTVAVFDPTLEQTLPDEFDALAPLTLTANISGALQDQTKLNAINLQLGQSDLKGEVMLNLAGMHHRPELDVALTSDQLRYEDFAPFMGIGKQATHTHDDYDEDHDESQEEESDEKSDRKKGKKRGMALNALNLFDLEFNHQIKRLEAFGNHVKDVSLTAEIEDGRLTLQPQILALQDTILKFILTADANSNPAEVEIAFETQDLALETIGFVPFSGINTSSNDEKTGNGLTSALTLSFPAIDDTEKLLEKLDGTGSFTLKETDLGGMTSAEGQRFDTLFEGALAGLELTKIGCMGIPFTLEDGILTIDQGVIANQTSLSLIDGDYDLVDRKIEMEINAASEGLSLPFKLSGLIDKPEVNFIADSDAVISLGLSLFGDQPVSERDMQQRQTLLNELPETHSCRPYLQ